MKSNELKMNSYALKMMTIRTDLWREKLGVTAVAAKNLQRSRYSPYPQESGVRKGEQY